MRKWTLRLLLLLLAVSTIGIGYGVWLRMAGSARPAGTVNALAHLPDYVQNATTDASVAYQFAIDNPEVLKEIPCYCGCMETLGHQHNLACYITAFNPDGTVAEYSDHGVY